MDRTFARLSIVAAILFLVIVLALMFLAPEVDALKYGISFYALTDSAFCSQFRPCFSSNFPGTFLRAQQAPVKPPTGLPL